MTEKSERTITGEEAFDLYQSYGFPLELVEEIANEKDFLVDKNGFNEALKKHQDVSRTGMEKKFGGVGKDSGEMGIKYHTLTHLLHTALRKVLGEHVKQMGSDINAERLRFDFAHSIKMTEEEVKKVEDLVNEKIKEDLIVEKQEMSLDKAISEGALAFFKDKYGEIVFVWTIFNPQTKEVFSKEVCGGPHVETLKDLGIFKIIKEESSSAGVRRIKAILK
jgi:alanyl-tRNA synthetase